MSMLEKYACLYGDMQFTAEERADIGAFAAGVIKCASTNDVKGLHYLLRRHFEYVDDATMEKIARYAEYIGLMEGPEAHQAVFGNIDKTAAPNAPWYERVGNVSHALLPAVMAATAAAPIVSQAIGGLRESRQHKKSLKEILQNHPELRNDPNTAKYFQTIVSFSPSVAKSPMVAGNLMRSFHEMGPGSINVQTIRDLLGAQESVSKASAPTSQNIREFGKGLGEASKEMREREKWEHERTRPPRT